MAFCQRLCNRVFQPPLQLRGVGIYSHGCKQGCFQPCRPDGSGPGWCSGLGDHVAGPMVQQRHGGEVHPGRVRPLAGMRGMSQRSFGAVTVLTVQQPSGLGRHGSAPGGRRTLRSAQRTRSLASFALRGEFISAMGRVTWGLTGRTGDHLGLNDSYPTGPTNCLARTRLTGSR